ncbi:TonB-dependent receptor [Sphingomonas cannabina]|uniref:TonB-dependent receptor n=1 Tax=Sphingomonas cannabina TaxID=2899123 RepID=UPI001F421C67|nr:TonB-dependent receptor [Sphingomonas cannabina]UIJ46752.1 TonB-dependent receptor [Sphingomonas cannabina]
MRGRYGLGLLMGAAMTWSLPAEAQTAPGQAEAPPQADRGEHLDDIIVTAQRREQSLQEVPISVTAFSSAGIAALSAESIGDLDTFTPGLTINDTSVTQPSFTIRGVATDDFGIGTDPSVGIFVDGIYSGRSGSSLIFFNDINRVEVLKGPQGTLFGRNTSGGAISIVTNKPSDRLEANGTLQVGNYGKVRADVTGNLPITGNLALRVNGVFNRRNGYLKDAITGEDREREHNTSARAALRWQPGANTDIILAYDHDDTDKDGPAAVGISQWALSKDPFGRFTNDVIGNRETRILNAVSLTATHRIGDLTLTSLSSFKHFETHNREDEDGTGDPTRYLDTENVEKNSSIYQELRLNFENDRWNIVAGGSYFHERGRQQSIVTALSDSVNRLVDEATNHVFPIFTILDSFGLPVFGNTFQEVMSNRAANDSLAAFADATFKVTPRLSLTAGIRYTRDIKRFSWFNGGFSSPGLDAAVAPGALYNAILGAPLFPDDALISASDFFRASVGPEGLVFNSGALEGVQFTRRAKFNDVSPRFVVQYDASDDVHLYASASRGYKAGGFNSVQINSFFAPEKVWNFEGGVKSELFDRRVRLNLSGYYFKYRNRQSISLESVGGGIPQYITRSGDSRAYGLDLDTQFVVTRDFNVTATAGLIDSKWVKRVEQDIDIGGQPTGEPVFRGILGLHYSRETEGGTIFGDASYSYTSRQRMNDASRAIDAAIADPDGAGVDLSMLDRLRSPRNIINARIGWRSPDNHYSVAFYAENLLNEKYLRTLNTITADTFFTPYVRRDRPGFYGVELGLRF